jgi:hypothetical protein
MYGFRVMGHTGKTGRNDQVILRYWRKHAARD